LLLNNKNEVEIFVRTKDYEICVYCFSATHSIIELKQRLGWLGIMIMCLSGVTCLPVLPVMKYCKQTQFRKYKNQDWFHANYLHCSWYITDLYIYFFSLGVQTIFFLGGEGICSKMPKLSYQNVNNNMST
jgi:hypothetical protein